MPQVPEFRFSAISIGKHFVEMLPEIAQFLGCRQGIVAQFATLFLQLLADLVLLDQELLNFVLALFQLSPQGLQGIVQLELVRV